MNARSQHGFTLMEMLIVIAIIAVLIGIAIPLFNGQMENARRAADEANERSAVAAALAEYMLAGEEDSRTYYYDAAAGDVIDTTPSPGYGQSAEAVENYGRTINGISVTGVPADAAISITVSNGAVTSISWYNGPDLSTPLGRKTADVNTMKTIADNLSTLYSEGKIKFSKNYVDVTVLKANDGTVKVISYVDGKGISTEYTDMLRAKGIDIDKLTVNADDTTWKNGFTVQINKNGEISYIRRTQWDNESNSWQFWYGTKITEEDMKVS